MSKNTKIAIGVIVALIVVAVATVVLVTRNSKEEVSNQKSNFGEITTANDLIKIVNDLYVGQTDLPSSLDTKEVDLKDATSVKSYTGLENGENFEILVESEPMMSSIAYSLVIGKVKAGVNANDVAKEISEKVDARKWICVSAEKLYATNSENIVFFIMSSEKVAKPIYEKFKTLAGAIGEEYSKSYEDGELPPDTVDTPVIGVPSTGGTSELQPDNAGGQVEAPVSESEEAPTGESEEAPDSEGEEAPIGESEEEPIIEDEKPAEVSE